MTEDREQTLGSFSGLTVPAVRHLSNDLAEFSFQRRLEELVARSDQRAETSDRPLEASDRGRGLRSAIAELGKRGHRTHGSTVVGGSDKGSEPWVDIRAAREHP